MVFFLHISFYWGENLSWEVIQEASSHILLDRIGTYAHVLAAEEPGKLISWHFWPLYCNGDYEDRGKTGEWLLGRQSTRSAISTILRNVGWLLGWYYNEGLLLDFTFHENSNCPATFSWCALLGRILKFCLDSAGKNDTRLVMSAMGMGEESVGTWATTWQTWSGKGLACFISSPHFPVEHFNLLLKSWAHHLSSGDSSELQWYLTYIPPLWLLSFWCSGYLFVTLFQLKWLEGTLGLGIIAGWYQYWLGEITVLRAQPDVFFFKCLFHLWWLLWVNLE